MPPPPPSHPFRASAQHGRIAVDIEVRPVGGDWLVLLTGGEAHLGACALGLWDRAAGRASASVLSAPGHREEEVALAAARHLAATTRARVVVASGLHYPAATAAEIEDAVTLCERLTVEATAWLGGSGPPPSRGECGPETS